MFIDRPSLIVLITTYAIGMGTMIALYVHNGVLRDSLREVQQDHFQIEESLDRCHQERETLVELTADQG